LVRAAAVIRSGNHGDRPFQAFNHFAGSRKLETQGSFQMFNGSKEDELD
jgi:hypothetical protein